MYFCFVALNCFHDDRIRLVHKSALQAQFHCDPKSLRDLEGLACHSKLGYQHANMLIGKLIKAVNDDTKIKNRSAYLSTGVRNAWVIVDAWYAGR